MGNLCGAGAVLFRLIADNASGETVAASRALLRLMEVEHAQTNMLGSGGQLGWPEHSPGDELSLHIAEMRSVLTAFVHETKGAPRAEAVRVALGDCDAGDLPSSRSSSWLALISASSLTPRDGRVGPPLAAGEETIAMGHEDWRELAYWTCVAGALLTYVVLAHIVGIVTVQLFFA